MRKTALALSLVATIGVVFFGVLQGILIAAILSILLFFRRSWWPPGAVLGYVPELKGYHDVERYPDRGAAEGHRHLPLGGAAVLRQRRHLPAARAQARRGRQPRWIVLQCEAITDIDVTAAEMLKSSTTSSTTKGIHFAFVELRDRLQERAQALRAAGRRWTGSTSSRR